MKTTTQKAIRSMWGLCLVILVYACTNETATPLTPFTVDELSQKLRALALPAAPAYAPIAVSVTPSTITASSKHAALDVAIANFSSGGGVPSEITQAVADINSGLAAAGTNANDLIARFTPQVLSTLETQGTLPFDLQYNTLNTIWSNGAVNPYLSGATFPQVNGNLITQTTTSIPQPSLVTTIVQGVVVMKINYAGPDACFKSANDLFDQKIDGLESNRQSQISTINSTYDNDKATIENELPSCITGKLSNYSGLIQSAKQHFLDDLQKISAVRIKLGESSFASLSALAYVMYSQQLQVYYNLQPCELNVCTIVKDTKLIAAKIARDTDINTINTNFNATITQAQSLVLQLYDACHNQGSGGN